jgi:hypothetical protein
MGKVLNSRFTGRQPTPYAAPHKPAFVPLSLQDNVRSASKSRRVNKSIGNK